MNTRKPEPIICRVCKQEHCVPCGKFAEIDYKTRVGVCRGCAAREAGKLLERANELSLLGAAKMNTLVDCLNRVKDIPGATAEIGVYKGGSALLIASTIPAVQCYLFDTFSGIPFKGENDVHNVGDFKDSSLEAVKALLKDYPNVQYRVGLFPGTVAGLENETYRFVHVDGDQYQTTKDALEYFYPHMVDGGIMLFDDFGWENCPGVAKALNEFLADKEERLEQPSTHQALVVKGKPADETVIDVRTSGLGIGDAICALYACCGAAKAGHKVRFHTDKTAWLTRASYPGVEIITSAASTGIDINQGYGQQLKKVADRKQWYCDNLARSLGIDAFQPIAPNIDRALHTPRLDTQRYVVLSPFSLWKSREWPKDNWREMARLLQRNGYGVVALHAGNEAEERLREYFGDIPGALFFWGHSADWVQEVMLSAHAVIGNDSGMAHVSGMLGVKTIAVHTHTKRHQLWSHTDVISVQATGYDCVGCNWDKERGFRAECNAGCAALRFTTPAQVMAAIGVANTKHSDAPVYTHENDIQAIFRAIDRNSKSTILEIGCNEGVTTRRLALRFPDRRIIGIDCTKPTTIRHEQKYEVPQAEEIGRVALYLGNIEILTLDSSEIDYSSLQSIDAIFIDGDHSYEGVKTDTEKALAYLKKRGNGVIVWHDAYPNPPAWCGVWTYLQELKKTGLDIEFVESSWVAYLRISQN